MDPELLLQQFLLVIIIIKDGTMNLAPNYLTCIVLWGFRGSAGFCYMQLLEYASEPQSPHSELPLKTGMCRREEPGWDSAECCVHTGSRWGVSGPRNPQGHKVAECQGGSRCLSVETIITFISRPGNSICLTSLFFLYLAFVSYNIWGAGQSYLTSSFMIFH